MFRIVFSDSKNAIRFFVQFVFFSLLSDMDFLMAISFLNHQQKLDFNPFEVIKDFSSMQFYSRKEVVL